MIKIKQNILGWLLYHANKDADKYLYDIKNRLLKHGTVMGNDIQFIEGKRCFTCDGTGIYHGFDEYSGRFWSDTCNHCYCGWYKRPVWNVLQIVRYGKHTFHQPVGKMYVKPFVLAQNRIEGYVQHEPTRYTGISKTVLFLLQEKGYLKRWYAQAGSGWYMRWYKPKHALHNLIHIIKKGKNAYPFHNSRMGMSYFSNP